MAFCMGPSGSRLGGRCRPFEGKCARTMPFDGMQLRCFISDADGSLFHAHNHLLAFGWALGTLF